MNIASKRSFSAAVFIALVIITTLLTAVFFQFTVDDAYITFRHSLNLVTDGVLSWNLDGPREEAFTNPLYVLMGAIGIKLGIKPELPIKIVSLAIFILWLNRAIKISIPATRAKRLLVSSVFLLCIPSYIHAYSGLETLLFAYLLFEYLHSEEVGHPRDISISLLLVLCRPEGALFVATSLGCLLVRRLRGFHWSSPQDRPWLFPALLIGLVAILVLGYKINYFGDFLPNTFYAKTGRPQGVAAVLDNVKSSAPWLLLASFVFQWSKLRGWAIAKYWGVAIMYLVYIRSGLAMNYADRFWYQLFWPLIIHEITANQNIDSCLSLFNAKRPFESFSSSRNALTSAIGLGWVFAGILGSPVATLQIATYTGRLVRSHAGLGWHLNRILPKDATVWVGDAGITPYYSRRMTYDLNFLGTKEIAKKGVTVDYLDRENPDVFVLYASRCSPSHNIEGKHLKEIEFIERNNYQYSGGFAWQSNYCLNVYSSPGIANILDKDGGFKGAQANAGLNDRRTRAGFLDDVILSYLYLFSPGTQIPSVVE